MNRISDLLTEVAACLVQQVEKDRLPDTPDLCFAGVFPGETAVGDYAGMNCDEACGMAWVRLLTAYPASGVGRLKEEVGNCGAEVGIDFEVGILRCIPLPDEDGTPPSASDLIAIAELQHSDYLTIMRALNCCRAMPNNSFLTGQYAPSGPIGGLVGGIVTVMTVV